ncbi:MAG TPA: alkaline phosphatase PhoX [Steroidobacteraceae bacterium]|nr:alkaline phosphatase PhoX [Steroidobacteraceae bacterium]
MTSSRRSFLARTLAASAALSAGPAFWRQVFAASAVIGASPYGPLGAPDANGLRLPAGFSARLIGVSGKNVAGTKYEWHGQPDGGSTFAVPGGGWVYVCNSELNGTRGGAGAVKFAPDGAIVGAYRILSGTKWNCAGGATPWNTWLSCEEHRAGVVWECNPFAAGQGTPRPALGKFAHEAAAVDPQTGYVYLTEDDGDGRFYRFRPAAWQDLSSGVLEAASVDASGKVTWIRVPAERPYRGRDTVAFSRGEGAWYSQGHVYFCTTADNRVWALDTASDQLEIIYDAATLGTEAPLREPDNVTVHEASGDIYVAEDDDDLQLVLLANRRGERVAAPFLQLVGHDGSEVTGPAFTPDGSRLYFSSQRGTDGSNDGPGMTFEVRGPFRS